MNDEQLEAAEPDRSDGTGHLSPGWTFARLLRGHPELADLRAYEAVGIVDQVLGADGWDLLPATDVWGRSVDPRDDFIDAWEKIETPIRFHPGRDQVMALVDRWPLASHDWPHERDRTYRRTVAFCYWVARLLDDDGRFFLSCRSVGEAMGVHYSQASRYLQRAVEVDEVLEILHKGDVATRLATVYRFRLDRVVVQGSEEEEAQGVIHHPRSCVS